MFSTNLSKMFAILPVVIVYHPSRPNETLVNHNHLNETTLLQVTKQIFMKIIIKQTFILITSTKHHINKGTLDDTDKTGK